MSMIVSRSSGFVRATAAAARVAGRWLLLLAAMATVPLASAAAADVYYDVDPLTAAIDGGTANWSDSNWKATQAGTSGGTWTANDTAIFDPIVGSPTTTTITLGGTETATAVTFNGAGYTLTGGTLSLAGTGATNWINVNADGAIESTLTHMRFKGTGEMTISGGGTIATRGVVGDGGNNLVTVRQTGGNFTINEYFMVGGNNVANSDGAYIMDAGSLTISQGIYLGWNGSSGSFTQNGGFVTTQTGNQGIQLGIGGGTGTYILNGGTLVSNFGQFGTPYSGTFTFGGGTFRAAVGFDTSRQTGVATTIADGATARIDTNGQGVTWSTSLTGASAAGLIKSGTGTLVLSGANSFAGATTVTGGTLQIGNSNALGNTTSTLTLARTNPNDNNTKTSLSLQGFSLSNPIVVGAKNPGVGDAGALQNTTAGTTSVLSGTVSLGGENYGGGAGNITFSGVISGGLSGATYSIYKQGAGTWTFDNEANTFDGFYYLIGGTTAVTKLANENQASSLGQPTTATANRVSFGFSGSGGGTIQYIGSSASTSDRAFVLQGATATAGRIDADGTSSAATLTLTGALSANRSGAYTAALGGTNAGVNTYSGVIGNGSGTVGLLKDGTTTWSLAGTNTYTGTTAVTAGTLLVNGDNSAATGAVTVDAGATLGGTGTVGGATTVSGTHSPGASPGLQTFSNGLSYASTGTLVWELSANTALSADRGTLYDGIDLTTAGALAIDPLATLDLVFDQPLADSTPSTMDWNNAFWGSDQQWVIADVSSPVTWDGTVFGTLNVGVDSLGTVLTAVRPNASFSLANSGGDLVLNYVAVPEPGTWALVAGAAAGMIALRCRCRTRNPC